MFKLSILTKACPVCGDAFTIARHMKGVYCSELCLLADNTHISDIDGCWLWTGRVNNKLGYGYDIFNGVNEGMHRRAYRLFNGEIPKGLLVRHLCHNKLCINPKHLEVGTVADNSHDAILAGRTTKGQIHTTIQGSRNCSAKLTETQAIEIYHSPISCNKLAAAYGVDQAVILGIKRKTKWKHIHDN